MKFSTKSRYALRMMEQLAREPKGTCLSLKEISESQCISLKYLEQIVSPLTRAGLLKSVRGSHGGYCLVKEPHAYTAGEIIRVIEGSLATIPCLEDETNICPRHQECRTLTFWKGLDEVIAQYMDERTLEWFTEQGTGGDFYSI